MAEVNQSNHKLQNQNKAAGKSSPLVYRASGAILLIFLFGIFWVYGWAGEIRYANILGNATSGLLDTKVKTQTIFGNLYIIDTIFVVIGFGLLLSYFKKSTTIAFFATIFTVSFTALVSPIFSKFWYNIFISNFQGQQIKTDDPSRFYNYSLGSLYVYLDYYNLRIAMANSISQLVVYLALFGRLSALQIILNTLLFNFVWNLNHFLCVYLSKISPDLNIFDDYQISNVYLFAATYGFIASLILKKPNTEHTNQFSSSSISTVLAHLGTFFLFLSFCATTTMYSLKFTLDSKKLQNQRSYIWQQAFISIFISMSASIIFNYAFSILLNPNSKIGIRGSLVGTITGAIMYGSVAGTSINIGAAIAVGLIAGSLSAVFFEKIYPAYNKSQVRDSFGGLSILLISFIGTFIIAPTVIKTYYNYNVNLPTLNPSNDATVTQTITNLNAAGWCLVNVGISLAIGLLGGLIIGGILLFFEKNKNKYYDDSEIFTNKYGLREEAKPKSQEAPNLASAQQLHQQ